MKNIVQEVVHIVWKIVYKKMMKHTIQMKKIPRKRKIKKIKIIMKTTVSYTHLAKAVGLRTEASSRYEKGLSPENAIRAVNRAIELVELLGAGETIDGMIDVYPTKQKTVEIPLEVERINKLLGINVSKEEMIKILNKLDIKVENDIVKPPFFRQDIEQTADVAEEILRFYGYDKLETTLVLSLIHI